MSSHQTMPFAAVPAEAARLSGLSKTEIYILLNKGVLEAKRSGRRTLVMMAGLYSYVESLPKATFGVRAPNLIPKARAGSDATHM